VDNFVDYLPAKALSRAHKRIFPALPENKATNKSHRNQQVKNNALTAQGIQAIAPGKRPQGVHDLTRM
jgi:hypothetical protein